MTGLLDRAILTFQSADLAPMSMPSTIDGKVLKEYLRRQAIWADAVGKLGLWPFGDLAEAIAPGYSFPLANEATRLFPKNILMPWTKNHWFWLFKFYEIASSRNILELFRLPDPCEPLLLLLSHGRNPHKENGSIVMWMYQVGLSNSQAEYSAFPTFIEMEEAQAYYTSLKTENQ